MAEWVSGVGSLLAVIVALAGYWLVERQRYLDETQRRQDAAYQIGFKLSVLSSEAAIMHEALNPLRKSDMELAEETVPMQICSYLQPKIGFDDALARNLSETEQNLLMRLKEEDFLMDFFEAYARNQSVRSGILEYNMRRDALTTSLPCPTGVEGEEISFELSSQELMTLQPRLIAAATLAQSVRALSRINTLQLARLGQKFRPMMQKHYPDLHIHALERVPTGKQSFGDGKAN